MPATPDDLTTLGNVKTFLGVADTTGDVFLQDRITRVSAQIRDWLNRGSLLSRDYARHLDGSGGRRVILPDWPVTALSILTVRGIAIPLAKLDGCGGGYRFVPWEGDLPGQPCIIEIDGAPIPRGLGTVFVSYTAGYRQTETITIPNGGQVTPAPAAGIFAKDAGVCYADGTPLVAVSASPATGQYVAPGAMSSGFYQFAAGDVGLALAISYSFVPLALEEACLEAVAWYWFRAENAMLGGAGIRSMKAGDTALTFGAPARISSRLFIDERITDALANFRRVFPV